MDKFLHISTAIYLTLIILIKMMAMPISLMEYSLNKNFIAASLCENKAKSEIHCGGKCFLGKKLAMANDGQDTQSNQSGSKIAMADYCETFGYPSFQLNEERLLHNTSHRVVAISARNVSSVFRPPIA